MKSILVTVGTTGFDELIGATTSLQFIEAAKELGYDQMFIQHGHLKFSSDSLIQHGHLKLSSDSLIQRGHLQLSSDLIKIESFDYCSNLLNYISKCDLVISHAGTGTVLECIQNKKKTIIVANSNLMDNHQLEFAERMAHSKHVILSNLK